MRTAAPTRSVAAAASAPSTRGLHSDAAFLSLPRAPAAQPATRGGGPLRGPAPLAIGSFQARGAVMSATSLPGRTPTAVAGSKSEPCDPSFVNLANELADIAGDIVRPYFRTPVEVLAKGDESPVTVADRAAEEAMRTRIHDVFPEHGVFGEEAGLEIGEGEGSKYMWVLDPIDGTKSFVTGKPLFGTLISLLEDGVPILGIIDQPILRERWVGVEGKPSTLNGDVIKTRACKDVSDAFLYATTPHMFAGETARAFASVRDAVRMPMYGCDCYAYGLLSAGFVDLVVEADLKPYDYMALVPVIKGAGGVITDWKGNPLSWNAGPDTFSDSIQNKTFPGEVCAAGDYVLHKRAIELLDW